MTIAWAHALLIELVDTVGETDTHPLRSLMEFVCRLVDDYEDKYVPKLTELFPELARGSHLLKQQTKTVTRHVTPRN